MRFDITTSDNVLCLKKAGTNEIFELINGSLFLKKHRYDNNKLLVSRDAKLDTEHDALISIECNRVDSIDGTSFSGDANDLMLILKPLMHLFRTDGNSKIVQQKLDSIIAGINTVNTNLGELAVDTTAIQTQLTGIATQLTSQNTKLTDVVTELQAVKTSVASINTDTTTIISKLDTVIQEANDTQTILQNEFDQTQVLLQTLINNQTNPAKDILVQERISNTSKTYSNYKHLTLRVLEGGVTVKIGANTFTYPIGDILGLRVGSENGISTPITVTTASANDKVLINYIE